MGNKIAQTKDLETLKRLAKNPAAPTKFLVKCLESDSEELRYASSSNSITPISELQRLSQDVFVRKGVSANVQTPTHILETLAKDPDCHSDLAGNQNVPATVLEGLFGIANNVDADLVNFRLACNPSTPAHVLQQIPTQDKSLTHWVAQNPRIPEKLIEQLSVSKVTSDRAGVAKNTSTSIEVLDRLATDEEMDVCLSVVVNPRFATRLNLYLKQLHNQQNWVWRGV